MGSPGNTLVLIAVVFSLLTAAPLGHSLVQSATQTQIHDILKHEGRLLQERTLSASAARSYATGNPSGWQPFYQVGLVRWPACVLRTSESEALVSAAEQGRISAVAAVFNAAASALAPNDFIWLAMLRVAWKTVPCLFQITLTAYMFPHYCLQSLG